MIIECIALALATWAPLGPSEYGLAIGTKKMFVLESKGQPAEVVHSEVVGSMQVQGMDVYDTKVTAKWGSRHEYFGLSPKGYFEFWARNMEATEVDTITKPRPLWKFDAVESASWTWLEPFRGQISSGLDGKAPNMADLDWDCVSTNVDADETITISAGKFVATHIRTVKKSKASGMTVVDMWFAPKVGLIKEANWHKDHSWSMTLSSVQLPK